MNNTQYDVLDQYGLSNDEELYIDLSDLLLGDDQEHEDEDEDDLCPSTTDKILPTFDQLIRYSVPSDNSCLFTSINFVLHNGKLNLSSAAHLRNLVATKIESDQTTYSEAILGRTNEDYSKWIRRGNSIAKYNLVFD